MKRLQVFLCLWLAVGISAARGAEPKTLRYALEIAETGFDPAEIIDLYSRSIAQNIFDAPLRFAYLAAPGTLETATADGMPQISSDYKTITVRIKKGIYFTDDPAFNGKQRELTAEDYVYSYKRFYDPHWNSPIFDGLNILGVVGMQALRENALKTGHFDYDRPVEGLNDLAGRTRPMLTNDRKHSLVAKLLAGRRLGLDVSVG